MGSGDLDLSTLELIIYSLFLNVVRGPGFEYSGTDRLKSLFKCDPGTWI
jgi:hypothetical protein